MPNLMKLGLAIAIAIVAGGLNWIYLNSLAEPTYCLTLNDGEQVKAGERFPDTADVYTKIPVTGDPKRLSTSLIPFDEENGGAAVFNAIASRDIRGGEPIFFSDVAEDAPRYDVLGPFTLLSVGEVFTGTVQREETRSSSDSAITVAPRFEKDRTSDYDYDTRRLLQIIDSQRQSEPAASHLRIVAIEARPSNGANANQLADVTASPDLQVELIRTADRAIIVPIEDIASIPEVLQIGTNIAFIVPAYP